MTCIAKDGIELHTWPPRDRYGGQHCNDVCSGVLALHTVTGIAYVSTEHRSQMQNRENAVQHVRVLINANAELRALALQREYK